ncbi:2-methylcitrate dehydratase PrpD [Paracoccus aminovorans]|uniref:2-methylcitrate dehydratase PrpD n=1 Tax=Paracoccus aminovorans TaxID=34004 RepID=A0A1I3DV16_9RHOB|nr:MmgE/PrpD family protein [Paracoccus aminovorans]CQR86918.1 2-methylcitrate dehydratase [Paracoccus aminovorans]SFH90483.1 2-methylcitrate dehydratase PrpD [Paracoccus aminovorans]
MTSLTPRLAARAAGLTFADLSQPARDWAIRALADTLACGIAGAGEEVVRLAGSVLTAGPGASALLGRPGRLHELDAAQINGISAHALDFDDCNLEMDGHPSVSIVPALLALADRLDSTGADLLTAYVAGVEAEIRIARIANPAHAERGWHPTVTFGVIGAAVACGRLLGLSPQRMAVAMGIAASCAAGLRANSGTMTKPLHAGQANRNGLQAALLAHAGFTANPAVLEHKFGFMAAFNGAVPQDVDAALDGWGQDFALLSPGIAIKQYPCCAFIHCAIDAAAQLQSQVAPAQIETIEVVLHRKRLKNIDRPDPRDGLDAKFSTQYLTARALMAGGVGFADFEAGRVFDPATRALAARVRLVAHDEADLSLGRVGVGLADGRVLSARASVVMGRGPANPMTPAQFRAKFDDCVARTLSPDAGASLFAALMDLPRQASIRRLSRLMQPAAPLYAE